MTDADNASAQEEAQYHTYETHRIPWWMRAIWLGFWLFTIGYFVTNLIPAAKHYF